MGETNQQGVEFQGPDGQGPKASEGQQQQTQKPEPGKLTDESSLTKDQVLGWIDEASKKTLSQAQSLVDKADSRLTKKMKEELAPIDEVLANSNLSPEQKSIVREKVISLSEKTETSGQQAPGQGPAETGEKGVDPVTALGLELQQKAGVIIEEGDPELSMVKVKGTPGEYIESLQQAIAAKQVRVGTSEGASTEGAQEPGEGGEDKAGGDPAARMPGLGTGGTKPNPIVNINDPKTLLEMGNK
jgi:hypothetical protein